MRLHTLMRLIAGTGLVASLALAAPSVSWAAGDGAAAEHHGEEHGDAGHDDGHHGDDHGDGHHVDYLADADNDGTPNWLDFDFGDEAMGGWPVLFNLGAHAFNLFLLLALLVFVARRPIGDAIRNRALTVRKSLVDSAESRDAAKARYDEVEARLTNFEAELAAMKAEAETEAAREEVALAERAEAAATRIAETAQRNVRDEVTRARFALRGDAVEYAVQLAENTLKGQFNAEDQRRLASEFLKSIGEEASNG